MLLRGGVAFGVLVVAITELLSPFHLLSRWPLAVVWIALCGAVLMRAKRPQLPTARVFDGLLIAAMAYHVPRVVYWAQAASVEFFPTPYLNQIMLPPLAEYMVLHTYLLSGGDRLANLVQWLGFVGCGFAVAALAGQMGAGRRGRVLAALFAMTLPNAILQASGAKNELLLAFWLAAMLWFAMRREALWCGAALGLALLTKGTAYLFAGPLLAAGLWGKPRWVRFLILASAPALALNAPQYVRNIGLSGSPLGFDSAHGDGVFRWQVEGFGVRPALSNALRHLSDQLGGRSPKWNEGVHRAVIAAHAWLGIAANDPRTTWRWATYDPPRNANHETNAPNRWHLAILVLGAVALFVKGPHRGLYAALIAGFWLFCFYLKWQPFQARMLAPLFVLGAPAVGVLLERMRLPWLQAGLCLLLLNNTRPYLMENWIRPLKGPRSVLRVERGMQYFADMTSWDNRDSYLEAVKLTARGGCTQVGIDAEYLSLEYPFQALLLEANPAARFIHVGVRNASARYERQPRQQPCAVLCLDCGGHNEKEAAYLSAGPPARIGRFLLFQNR